MSHLKQKFNPYDLPRTTLYIPQNQGISPNSFLFHDVKPHHHEHVFVDNVVAVNGVFAKKVPRSQKDLNLLVGPEYYHVLPALFGPVRGLSVPQKDPKFLEVNVNWVRPG
jgi:hypothetical protein